MSNSDLNRTRRLLSELTRFFDSTEDAFEVECMGQLIGEFFATSGEALKHVVEQQSAGNLPAPRYRLCPISKSESDLITGAVAVHVRLPAKSELMAKSMTTVAQGIHPRPSVVTVSPGAVHAVWLLSERYTDRMPFAHIAMINVALAQLAGGDKSETKLCPLLPIPGFSGCEFAAGGLRTDLRYSLDDFSWIQIGLAGCVIDFAGRGPAKGIPDGMTLAGSYTMSEKDGVISAKLKEAEEPEAEEVN